MAKSSRSLCATLGLGLALLIFLPVFLPIYIALMLVFFAVWLALTVTCIGPGWSILYGRADEKLLASLTSPGGPCRFVPVPGSSTGRRIAVRWTKGDLGRSGGRALPPVVVPNGLGATLITIGGLHDRLAEMGFPVLTFDRAGVGLSDCLDVMAVDPRTGRKRSEWASAGAEELISDMDVIMDFAESEGLYGTSSSSSASSASSASAPAPSARWIVVGPSMGSIVGQCYVAARPHRVCGFHNMDGFPFPFAAKRRRFELAGYVYRMYASIVWTGILRPIFYAVSGKLRDLSSPAFPLPVVRAQMNQRNFFASLAREMVTMMDCADYARRAWGPGFDLQTMDKADFEELVRARPAAYGDFTTTKKKGEAGAKATGEGASLVASASAPSPTTSSSSSSSSPASASATASSAAPARYTWEEKPRSEWEHGEEWGSVEDAKGAVAKMLAASAAAAAAAPHKSNETKAAASGSSVEGVLPGIWKGLVVRVMSARGFNFPLAGPKSFFDDEMKAFAAAEHTLHATLARSGRRTAFPTRHHGQMFFGVEAFIADQVAEIAEELASLGADDGGAAAEAEEGRAAAAPAS